MKEKKKSKVERGEEIVWYGVRRTLATIANSW